MKENQLLRARITATYRERFEFEAEPGGGFARLKRSLWRDKFEIFPTTGDYVMLEYNPDGDSVIVELLPRTSLFLRADVYTRRGVQALAANFDYVFIVTSMNHEFNMRRLERYLSATIESGAQGVIVLTKCDLCADPSLYICQTEALKLPVCAISSVTGEGIADLRARFLRPGQTVALLGSSGVGKSSLVNALSGGEVMGTGAIREEDAHGRHTTTHRQLLHLPCGASVIDTPGLRELAMYDAVGGVEEVFADLNELSGRCRFSDCKHHGEPGCAIEAALRAGSVDSERVKNFLTIHQEARRTAKRAEKRRKVASSGKKPMATKGCDDEL